MSETDGFRLIIKSTYLWHFDAICGPQRYSPVMSITTQWWSSKKQKQNIYSIRKPQKKKKKTWPPSEMNKNLYSYSGSWHFHTRWKTYFPHFLKWYYDLSVTFSHSPFVWFGATFKIIFYNLHGTRMPNYHLNCIQTHSTNHAKTQDVDRSSLVEIILTKTTKTRVWFNSRSDCVIFSSIFQIRTVALK